MLFGDIIKGIRVSYGNSWWWNPRSLVGHSHPLMFFKEKNLELFLTFVRVATLFKKSNFVYNLSKKNNNWWKCSN